MKTRNYNTVVITGLIAGLIAVGLVLSGNPKNMGFCIACFIRDTAGALGLHQAGAVQYIRPEIIGLVLGSFFISLIGKEHKAKGGSAPLTRFVLGICVMVGALMFLGCPFRMVLRLAGGDLNALTALAGFAAGIGAGVFFMNRGFTLKRNYELPEAESYVMPAFSVALIILLTAAPAFIYFSQQDSGPGALHAPILVSLAAGLIVGAAAQKSRFCMVGGIRDMYLFGDTHLLKGFAAMFLVVLLANIILTVTGAGTYFTFGFENQPVAHTAHLWNFLGMFLTGYASCLLGGCPLRQLILSGEGNTDSGITVMGMLAGAAICHNFGLASSGAGPTVNGKIAVTVCIAVVTLIAVLNRDKKDN